MNDEIQEIRYLVGEAWKGTYSPTTPYGNANVVQDPTGLSVYRSLKPGNVDHPLTDTAWWFCIIDLSSIKAESDRIAALNQAIAQDEQLRVAAEELRQQHEAERVAAETQRNEAEQQRISAEQNRVNAESARETAEQQRITAEEGRVSAENARVTAEQARVLAETLRANAEEQRAANEQNRVAAEQQRIERAEQDHQRAESDHATYVDSLGAFDISSYHATDGVLAKYADLTAALGTGGANIPDDLRKGGMSVKFVQSSDNKYVQFRCMAQNFTTDVTQWQGVDEEPTAGSDNLVKSGGAAAEFDYIKAQLGGIIFGPISVSTYYPLSFLKNGNTIRISNLITSNRTLYIRKGDTSEGQVSYIIPAIGNITITLTDDFTTLFYYVPSGQILASFKIEYLGSIYEDKALPKPIDTLYEGGNNAGDYLSGDMGKFLADQTIPSSIIDGFSFAGKHADCVYTPNLKAGDIIEITNTSDDSLNIYFRIAYNDNTNQENLMIPKGETRNIRLQHDQNFLYFHHPTTPTKIYTGIVKKNTQSVVIEKIDDNSFFVIVNRQNGKTLKHKFYHSIVEGDYEYGNGQTIHLKSSDCWFHGATVDENNIDVVQGDTDFVNQIYAPAGDAFSGEGSYVGEMHGCSLQAYTKFFADGIEFNPMELTSLLLCENFRFVEKVNYYADLADDAVGGVAYPKLTETGEMILSNIHFADAIYRSDGSSSLFNKLTVQRDGTKFTDLYAGWIRGYNSYFDEVVLNNEENTDNEFIYNSGWNVTPLNGSTVDISLINRIKGDNILMIGNRAVVSQNIKMVNRTNLKCSYRTQFYQDSTPSLKIYQVPVITRLSMDVMGEQMETFNQGDTIECYIERKIDVK